MALILFWQSPFYANYIPKILNYVYNLIGIRDFLLNLRFGPARYNMSTFQINIERAKIEISATIEKPEAKEINDKESNQLENKTTMKKVTYEIEEDLHNQLKIKAIMEKRKVSEIVNDILKAALSE